MSVLGPISFPVVLMASSASGSTARSPAATERFRIEIGEQKLLADDARLARQDLDDSVETEFSHGQVGDREPDGRLPWQFPGGEPQPESLPGDETSRALKPPCDDERGQSLDLNA